MKPHGLTIMFVKYLRQEIRVMFSIAILPTVIKPPLSD